jgi:hypothetical protein
VVNPDTVVRWHRAGFQLYWRLVSRVREPVGRRPVSKELIFKLVAENPTWRAPRIHGELVMLGYEISERSVSRWMRHAEPRVCPALAQFLTQSSSRKEIYDYSGRLMRDLHYPAIVLPTHWDNFLAPFEASQQPALEALQSFVQEIVAASPKTRVIVPKYFESIPLDTVAKRRAVSQ